jgi:hypothetical protein
MFILPLGIVVYFWDRRNYSQNLELFGKYIDTISRSELSNTQKMGKINEMFYQNGYRALERSELCLVVTKKHFNIGILFILLGLLTYFGLFIYLLYYRYFQKPRILKIDLNTIPMLQERKK